MRSGERLPPLYRYCKHLENPSKRCVEGKKKSSSIEIVLGLFFHYWIFWLINEALGLLWTSNLPADFWEGSASQWKKTLLGSSLVQWLGLLTSTVWGVFHVGLLASTVGGTGAGPGRGTKIPLASQHGQTKKRKLFFSLSQLVVVQSISHVRLFATSWTAALQNPLSSPTSRSLLRFVSIALVIS